MARELGIDYFQVKPVFPQRGSPAKTCGLDLLKATQLVHEAKLREGDGLEIHIKRRGHTRSAGGA